MNRQRLKLACIQNCASDDLQANISECEQLTRAAASAGAGLVCLPEYFAHMEPSDQHMLEIAYPEKEHPALPVFTELARELTIWILAGSLAIKLSSAALNNRSYLISDQGRIVARYNKLHLFDARLKGGEESYAESDTVQAGELAALAETPWGKLGMSICYDLRFASLYRHLAQAGASLITVPAAFTQTTGQAHWHTLIRARAIETGSFIVAPNQCGVRHWGRATYGHSLIVDPWGETLADAGPEPGFIVADIDLARVAEVRATLPSLEHDRDYELCRFEAGLV